jgi:hypothetical protein
MRTTRGGTQRLNVDDLGDQDAVILTIDGAEIKNFGKGYLNPNPEDQKVVLTFKETGDAELVLNATSYHRLVARYGGGAMGGGFTGWIGKACVLVAEETTNPQTREKTRGLWVAAPGQWTAAERAEKDAAKAAKPAAKRARK